MMKVTTLSLMEVDISTYTSCFEAKCNNIQKLKTEELNKAGWQMQL
jgi:hypothetical protein